MATAKKTSSKPLSKSAVIEALIALGHKELKKTGMFVLHGFAKFVVV